MFDPKIFEGYCLFYTLNRGSLHIVSDCVFRIDIFILYLFVVCSNLYESLCRLSLSSETITALSFRYPLPFCFIFAMVLFMMILNNIRLRLSLGLIPVLKGILLVLFLLLRVCDCQCLVF